eukprot:1768583-Lingulodinium_polyedra.AAC.1
MPGHGRECWLIANGRLCFKGQRQKEQKRLEGYAPDQQRLRRQFTAASFEYPRAQHLSGKRSNAWAQ